MVSLYPALGVRAKKRRRKGGWQLWMDSRGWA